MQTELAPLPYDRWLTAKQLAAEFSLNEESAYRWRDSGIVPERFVKYCGSRRLLFHPETVRWLEVYFSRLR